MNQSVSEISTNKQNSAFEGNDINATSDQQQASVEKNPQLKIVSISPGAATISQSSVSNEQRSKCEGNSETKNVRSNSISFQGCPTDARFTNRVKRQLNFGQRNASRFATGERIPLSGSQGDGSFSEAHKMYDGSYLEKGRDYDGYNGTIGLYDDEIWGNAYNTSAKTDTSSVMPPPPFDTPHSENLGKNYTSSALEYGQHYVGDQSVSYQHVLSNRMSIGSDHYQRASVSYMSPYNQPSIAYQSEYSAVQSQNPYVTSRPTVNSSILDPISTQADRTLELEYLNNFSTGMYDFEPSQHCQNGCAVSLLAPTSLTKEATGRSSRADSLVSTNHTEQRPNSSGRTNRQPTEGKLLSTVSLSETDKRKISILTKPGKTRKTSLLSFTMHSDSTVEEQVPTHARKKTISENEVQTVVSGKCVQELNAVDRAESLYQVADVGIRDKMTTPKSTKHNDVTSARCRAKDHRCSSAERNSAIIHELLTSERDDSYPVFVVRQNNSISSTGNVKKDPSIIAVRKAGCLDSRPSLSVVSDHAFMTASLGNSGVETNSIIRRKIRQVGPRSQRRARSKSASISLTKTASTKCTTLSTDVCAMQNAALSERAHLDGNAQKDASENPANGSTTDRNNDREELSDSAWLSLDPVLPAHGRRAWSCDTGSILRRRVGPRRARERVRNGRRLSMAGVTPKRSPRLLLKTRLADRPDNHLDDFVYQSLKRKDDHKTPKGRRIRSAASSSDGQTDSVSPQKRNTRRSPASASNDDLLAVLTRSKSKTPDKGGCSSAYLDLLPDSSLRKRRLGGTELLSDARLGKHACLLWSSEQRRRFQQENPDANSEELDSIMRRYWEQLGEKDRLRYYQRARNAVSDRLRHTVTSQRQGVAVRERPPDGATFDGDTGAVGFDRLPPTRQNRLLKDLLIDMQRRLPRRQYHLLMRDYAASFRLAREQLARKRGAGAKHAQIGQQTWLRQIDSIARRLLYVKLKEATPAATRMTRVRRAARRRQLAALYRGVVCDLMEGIVPHASNSVEQATRFPVSTRLSETIADLNDIIADDKEEAPDGNTLTADDKMRIDVICKDLQDSQYSGTMRVNGVEHVPKITNTYFEKRVLHDSKYTDLTPLSVDDVDNFFKHATPEVTCSDTCSMTSLNAADLMLAHAQTALYRDISGFDRCCALNDPSCILNHLLIVDKLQRHEAE